LISVAGNSPSYIAARDIRVGDKVYHEKDGRAIVSHVTSIKQVTMRGLFAPFTMHGVLFVDGVATSCYAVLRNHTVFHAAMAPVRLLSRLLPFTARLAHAHGGIFLRGAHGYVDFLSILAPFVRWLGI